MDDWKSQPCFYVSVIDADRWGLLAGPFPTHGLALDLVDRIRKEAYEIDGKAWFYAYGTCRIRDEQKPPGLLNDRIGYDEIIRAWEKAHQEHEAWQVEERQKERDSNVQMHPHGLPEERL